MLESITPRIERLEERYQQLGGATDERIDDAITAYLNDADHFCDRVNTIIQDWYDSNDDGPTARIKRVVGDMIDSGDIVVSLDLT